MTTTGIAPAKEEALPAEAMMPLTEAAGLEGTAAAGKQPPERVDPPAAPDPAVVQPPSSQQANLPEAKVQPPNLLAAAEPGEIVSRDTAKGNTEKKEPAPLVSTHAMGESEVQGEQTAEMMKTKDRVPTVKTEIRTFKDGDIKKFEEIHKERFVALGASPEGAANTIDIKDADGNKIGSLLIHFRQKEVREDGRKQNVIAAQIGEEALSTHKLELKVNEDGKQIPIANVEVKINPQLVDNVTFQPGKLYENKLPTLSMQPEQKEKDVGFSHVAAQEERKAMAKASGAAVAI